MSHIDRFTCEDLFRRLDDYLDRRLSEEENRLVLEHLATCAVCAMEYKFGADVLEQVKEKVRRIDVPRDLLSKIMDGIDDKPKEKP